MRCRLARIVQIGQIGAMLAASPSFGHPLDLGHLAIEVRDQEIQADLDLNPKAAAAFRSTARTPDLMHATLGSASVQLGEQPCRWVSSQTMEVDDTGTRLSARAECPAAGSAITLELPFLKEAPATFQIFGRIRVSESETTVLADPTHWQMTATAAPDRGLTHFIAMGARHIGAATQEWIQGDSFHLPEGIDHILFLVSLIIGGSGMLGTIKTATGFTLGHSITLALASLGWVRLPSRLVESAIAFSIAYVALEVLILRKPRQRFKLAAFFGLVHGFGFASALQDLNLQGSEMLRALLGFNLGVEAGQAAIILLLQPLILAIQARPILTRYAIPSSALAIAFVSSYWFLQRALGY